MALHDDNFLAARADPHDETRDWVDHEALQDATVLVVGDDTDSEVLLAWRTDRTLTAYPLQAAAAAVLAGDLRRLAADAHDAHLDPVWRRPPDTAQELGRYTAHTRKVPFLAEPGRLDWLAARLPWGAPGPEPLVLLGGRPTLVLTDRQAVTLAGMLDGAAAAGADGAAVAVTGARR